MSRAAAITEVIRSALASAEQLSPAEQDGIYRALVADLRSRRPECVSVLTLGPPTDTIRDPRVSR